MHFRKNLQGLTIVNGGSTKFLNSNAKTRKLQRAFFKYCGPAAEDEEQRKEEDVISPNLLQLD
jgi:hypothetical protein